MKEVRYFYCPDIASGFLPEEEARHALRVLRLGVVPMTSFCTSASSAQLHAAHTAHPTNTKVIRWILLRRLCR